MVFPKFGGKAKKECSDDAPREERRVFESQHMTADLTGSTLIVRLLSESVTEREAMILTNEADPLLSADRPALVVDLGLVGVLTSAGIGALVRLHKRMEEVKGKMAVCGLNPDLAELFRLTRMDRLFLVVDSREQALARLGS
jgi:anti-sigma B factor antagonist